MNTTTEKMREAFSVDYCLDEMPNGAFVGEVYLMTHDLSQALEVTFERGCKEANKRFMAAEKLLRDYVWRASQRAHQAALASLPRVTEGEVVRVMCKAIHGTSCGVEEYRAQLVAARALIAAGFVNVKPPTEKD